MVSLDTVPAAWIVARFDLPAQRRRLRDLDPEALENSRRQRDIGKRHGRRRQVELEPPCQPRRDQQESARELAALVGGDGAPTATQRGPAGVEREASPARRQTKRGTEAFEHFGEVPDRALAEPRGAV